MITLGIIGIVAALTIFSLIEKYNERVYIIKIKKAYNTLEQAVKFAVAEYGPIDTWPADELPLNPVKDRYATNFILKYIDGAELCETFRQCFSDKYKNPDGTRNFLWYTRGYKGFKLKDGSSYSIAVDVNDNNRCKDKANDFPNYCGTISVDITGPSGPNIAGKDYVNFMLTRTSVLPLGVDGGYYINSFETGCLKHFYNCSGWIIYNDNMDYLHCPEKLGWHKARSCK